MFHVPQSRDMNKTKHFEYNRDDCCPRPAQTDTADTGADKNIRNYKNRENVSRFILFPQSTCKC